MKSDFSYDPNPTLLKRGSHVVVDSFRLKQIKERVRLYKKKAKNDGVQPRFLDEKFTHPPSNSHHLPKINEKLPSVSNTRRPSGSDAHLYHTHKVANNEKSTIRHDISAKNGPSKLKSIDERKNHSIQPNQNINSSRQSNLKKFSNVNSQVTQSRLRKRRKDALRKETFHNRNLSDDIPYDDEFIMSDNETSAQNAEDNDAPNMMTLTFMSPEASPKSSTQFTNISPKKVIFSSDEILNESPRKSLYFDEAILEDSFDSPKEEEYKQHIRNINNKRPRVKEYPSSIIAYKSNKTKNLRRQTEPTSRPRLFVPRKHASPLRDNTFKPYNPSKLETTLNVEEYASTQPKQANYERHHHSNHSNHPYQTSSNIKQNLKPLKNLKVLRKRSDSRPISIAGIRNKYTYGKKSPNRYQRNLPKTAPQKTRKTNAHIKETDHKIEDRESSTLLQKLQEQERQYQLKLHKAIAETKLETESKFQDMLDSFNHEQETLSYIKEQLEQREQERERLKKELENLRQNHNSISPFNDESLVDETPIVPKKDIFNILLIDLIHIPHEMESNIITVLKVFRRLCSNVIENLHGTEISSIGNTLMAIFGMNEVEACIECALEILQHITSELNHFIQGNNDKHKEYSLQNLDGNAQYDTFENRIYIGAAIARGSLQHVSGITYVGKILQKVHLIGMQLPAVKHKLAMDEEFSKHIRAIDKFKQRVVGVGSIQISAHQEQLYSILDSSVRLPILGEDGISGSENVHRSLSPSSPLKSTPKKRLGLGTIGRIFKLRGSQSSPLSSPRSSISPEKW